MPRHFVAFWNVENLFAPEGFPGREPWLAQAVGADLRGWTQALFDTKLGQLRSIIAQMNAGQGPDILGVCEIENAFVLQQLSAVLDAALPGRHYAVVHADNTRDQRGIDTAFLYDANRYTVDPTTVFSHWVMRRTGTRDITQVTFRTQANRELILLSNHWPSRSGGAHESRGFRMTAGETLSYWHEQIWRIRGNETPVLAMGDFNDDPFDESVRLHARASRERGDIERALTAAQFYNLAWRYLEQAVVDRNGDPKLLHGTLYFDGDANVFDQLLASKGLLLGTSPLRILEETARIEAFPAMVDHRTSYGPIRFGLPNGDAARYVTTTGFSDHFPVSVVIDET